MACFIALLVLLAASSGHAGRPSIEITPFVGYRWGGGIGLEERAFRGQDFDLAIDPSGSYGLRVGADITQRLQLELLVSRQDGRLQDEYGLFGEEPGGFLPQGDTDQIDFGVTCLHAGLLWHFTGGANRIYGLASAGIIRTDPAVPLPSEQRLSLGAGVGIKLDLTAHQGLRFELRSFWADTDGAARATEALNHPDCAADVDCTYTYLGKSNLVQTELTFGYVLKL